MRKLAVILEALFLLLAGIGHPASSAVAQEEVTPRRPIPGPVVLPPYFQAALERATRSPDGSPGPAYWQVYSEYDIAARLDPASGLVSGEETIRYHNRSPAQLDSIALFLHQNVHAEGVIRNEPMEVTGGIRLGHVRISGSDLLPVQGPGRTGYRVDGGVMWIHPPDPLPDGETIELEIGWSFFVPRGAAERMGHIGREMYLLAYWFPKLAVFDDLRGWDAEPYMGQGEFYDGFGDYDVELTVPEGWITLATGTLRNPEEVFSTQTRSRMIAALAADTMVQIATPDDLTSVAVTEPAKSGTLTYRFSAENVRDFVWTASNTYSWTGTSALVPDRDGDGEEDRVAIHALWRESEAPLWGEQALYGKRAIEYASRFTGISYPWPHMTSVEGTGITDGGMEYPMLTLMYDAEDYGAVGLFELTAHELGHMWVPMIVGANEKRHAWIDEGLTSFLETEAGLEYRPDLTIATGWYWEDYLNVARNGLEQSMMRHHDHYEPGPASGAASYSKPSLLLISLRILLGEEPFQRAYQTFLREWSFKHPTPWDFFNTFERVSGRDLDWFWTSWFYETWVLDHAVESVARDGGETVVKIVDLGFAPMPARVRIETTDAGVVFREIPVSHWLRGETSAEIHLPGSVGEVLRVEIDPDKGFPDVDRTNNVWERT